MARPPKPRDLKVIQGTFDASRDRAGVPNATGAPVKPAWVKGAALKVWRDHVKRAPWLKAADSVLLGMWCVSVAALGDAPAGVSRMGEVRRLGNELGFSPPGRVKMGARAASRSSVAERYFP